MAGTKIKESDINRRKKIGGEWFVFYSKRNASYQGAEEATMLRRWGYNARVIKVGPSKGNRRYDHVEIWKSERQIKR